MSEILHTAVCQAVALLNRSPEIARCAEGREVRDILRLALADHAALHEKQLADEASKAQQQLL